MIFLYCVTDSAYVDEFRKSVKSLKRHCPGADVYLYTDLEAFENVDRLHIIRASDTNRDFIDKIEAIDSAPKPLMYLDTDTYVMESLNHLSEVIENFSMAGARAPIRYSRTDVSVPDWVPEINGGVLLFSDDETAERIISKWKELQLKEIEDENAHTFRGMTNDQSALRRVVYEYLENVYILPEEYNLRCNFPFMIHGNSKPKIIHARDGDLRRGIEAASQKTFTPRAFADSGPDKSLPRRLAARLKSLVKSTFSKANLIVGD